MTETGRTPLLPMAALALILAGTALGWWLASIYRPTSVEHAADTPSSAADTPTPKERKVLYWYDPMQPQQHFAQPGPSPFMDMELIPKYAEADSETANAGGISVDAAASQSIGLRLAETVRIPLGRQITASGLIGFNERDVAIVQARSGGFVERVWPLAAGDVVKAGQPLAELLVPDWAAAQRELLALRQFGEDSLLPAARERLVLLGMPANMIVQLEKTGRVQSRYTIVAPLSGVVQSLDARAGMTLSQGQTVARVNGLANVWLEVAVPEALAASFRTGDSALINLTAFPGRDFKGRIFEIVPTLNAGSRSARVRIELPNADRLLLPGQSAQVVLADSNPNTGLAVPNEAVIRSGKRNLVMLALAEGRYLPQEVKLGPEIGNLTVISAGLQEGQSVVASGQFLLDSEASLNGITAQTAEPEASPAMPAEDSAMGHHHAADVTP